VRSRGAYLLPFWINMTRIACHLVRLPTSIFMSRRSTSFSPRPSKRVRLDTNKDFKDGVFLAPMVRSGACMSEKLCFL
jgi:hypothetical protein